MDEYKKDISFSSPYFIFSACVSCDFGGGGWGFFGGEHVQAHPFKTNDAKKLLLWKVSNQLYSGGG